MSDDALDALAHEHPLLARCLAASQQGAVGLGDDAGRRLQRGGYGPTDGRGGAERDSTTPTPGYGFNLHAGLRVPANDRKRLERLCRCILSPPVSAKRISRTADDLSAGSNR